jgi:hypothetical protein
MGLLKPLKVRLHALDEAFSVHQNLQQLKIDVRFSEGKVSVSFPTPFRPYFQVLSI